MEVLIVVGILVVIAGILFVWYQTNTKMDALRDRLIETGKMQGDTVRSFGEIQRTLGRLGEASRHMEQVGREITGLSDLLRAPKLRGGIGELFLGDLLAQILAPEQYQLQYGFKSGERVDAAILLKDGIVPVDAKFPLESFQRMLNAAEEADRNKHRREFTRTVKERIDEISRKYIVPDEGTFDFALMYIPAENVYYETILRDDQLGEQKGILGHALNRRVIPVSPNSFYAYLQAIALGLKGMQIEKQAQDIMGHLSRLEGDFDRFRTAYGVLGGHLEKARKKYEETERVLDRFEAKLSGAWDPSRGLPEARAAQEVEQDGEDDSL